MIQEKNIKNGQGLTTRISTIEGLLKETREEVANNDSRKKTEYKELNAKIQSTLEQLADIILKYEEVDKRLLSIES